MKKVQSTCNYCAIDCNLDFYVEEEKIIKVVPTKGHPINDGFCCIKGLSLDKQQSMVKSNSLPKIKQQDGTMKEMSWDETYKYIANKIKDIQEKYGQESLAGISTGQLALEEFAILGHIMRNYLKTNLDGNTRLCMATSVVAHKQSFGFDAPGFTLKDLELSDTIFFIGANPVVAHPIVWEKVKKNPNKKVIVLDPRRSETAQNADYWVPLNWRSDLVLLYTIANQLISNGYINKEYIQDNTEGFEEFKEFVKVYTPEKTYSETGISPDEVNNIVNLIHKGKRVSFWWTMGVNQGYEAVRTAQAIINIALMTGNIGKAGTGANSITGQCNAMGSRAYSNTAGLYGGGDFDNPIRRKAVAEALKVPEEVLASKPTATYNKIIEDINDGKIKALWVVCTNPMHSWTNNKTFEEAVSKLELFIVQDIYETTESAEKATVFLPVVPGIKKEGTLINMERRLSALRPCLRKNINERSDYEVFYGIGKALGMGSLLDGWETPKSCFELMKRCSKGMPCDITGVTWDGLTGSNGVQWPFREGEEITSNERRLYEDGKFYTPNKKAKFIFEKPLENPMPTNDEFPFILNTGRGTVGQWHTQTRTKEVRFVEEVSIEKAYLYMNTELANEKGIEENEQIRVFSKNGENELFYVKITDNVRYKELYAPLHYIQCNRLTPSIYDAYSKEPSYKATPVHFKRISKKEVGYEEN